MHKYANPYFVPSPCITTSLNKSQLLSRYKNFSQGKKNFSPGTKTSLQVLQLGFRIPRRVMQRPTGPSWLHPHGHDHHGGGEDVESDGDGHDHYGGKDGGSEHHHNSHHESDGDVY